MVKHVTYNRRITEGVCVMCGGERHESYRRCRDCLKKWRDAQNARNMECRETGICTRCHTKRAVPGIKSCQSCREYINAYYRDKAKRRHANGRCVSCGVDSQGYYKCIDCAKRDGEAQRRWYRKHRARVA